MEVEENWDDPASRAALIRQRIADIISGLTRIARAEAWSSNELNQLHARLKEQELKQKVLEGERLFSKDERLRNLQHQEYEHWGLLINFTQGQTYKYIGSPLTYPTHNPTYRHLRRLQAILREVGVAYNPPEFAKARTTWRPFLDYCRDYVVRRADQAQRNADGRANQVGKPVGADQIANSPVPQTESDHGLILDDPREEARHLRDTQSADSLKAKFEHDYFEERGSDIEFLKRFLAWADDSRRQTGFRWTLVTGSAGEGKTRLAIQFLSVAETLMFRVGFLPTTRAEEFDAVHWRPKKPTLIVIDYPAESPAVVARLLREFASTAVREELKYPLRVLLLEREAAGDWFKIIAPVGSDVRGYCYSENAKSFEHQISPLSSTALLSIMRGRLSNRILSDDMLLDMLARVDPHTRDKDGSQQRLGRPLFAAATAMAIADVVPEDCNALTAEVVIYAVGLKDILARVIERERERFWFIGNTRDRYAEKRRLDLHENLLVVATIALDLPRESYDDACPTEARQYLPNIENLDIDRYHRMAGGNPTVTLSRLQPDILGELFVLDRLATVSLRERQALIDAGLSLGGDKAAQFLIRCAMDFGSAWRSLGFLKPSRSGPAIQTFAKAMVGLACVFKKDQIDDVNVAMKEFGELANLYPELMLHELVANALLNQAVTLGSFGYYEDEIALYESIIHRYGVSRDLGLCVSVARARIGKGQVLYDMCVSRTKSFDLVVGEIMQSFDEVVTAHGTADENVLRTLVGTALLNKGVVLDEIGRRSEAMDAFFGVFNTYKSDQERELCAVVARALYNWAVVVAGRYRPAEAIFLYDELLSRYGEANELEIRQVVAMSLHNKAALLNDLGRGDEAAAICEYLVSQFRAANDPLLRNLAERANFIGGAPPNVVCVNFRGLSGFL
jgi:tetratricopeptide (TPR) repeat protein